MLRVIHFKNRIRELREKKGMTQKELAYECFVSQNSISNLELGLYCPRASVSGLIAKALDVSWEECFFYETEEL